MLTRSGLNVSKASVVYINNEYTRDGDIDVNQLFAIEDVTDRVKEKAKRNSGRNRDAPSDTFR